jgi:DNA-binding MarR family transcriptional regulator
VTEIADNVDLSPSTVVGIVDRLEEKALVVRERDTKDRRVVFVKPTKAGKELVKETRHPVQALFDDRTEDRFSDADYERIATSLEDIARALGAEEQEAQKPPDAVGPVDGVLPDGQ